MIGYPNGQDGAILSAWDYLLCPTRKINSVLFLYDESLIDQACLVKIAVYWTYTWTYKSYIVSVM